MIEYLSLETKMLCVEDFVMNDGSISFRKDTAYPIVTINKDYISLKNEQGEVHYMNDKHLLACMIAI